MKNENSKGIKVGINGFGRIGRQFFRLAAQRDDLEVVAINDLGDKDNLLYLLKYDSAYGKFDSPAGGDAESEVKFFQEKDPQSLPWGELGVDIVVESTGFFTKYEDAQAHIAAGAKRVVISAPSKSEDGPLGKTILMGVNEPELNTCSISSNGSCTTNAASPVAQIMEEALDIEKALLNTIHGYTSSQSIIDAPNKKNFRLGRAAAVNIIPSTTGAAKTVTKAVQGVPFFDGIAVRVPVVAGSLVDLTFVTKKETTVEEVNDILRKAAKEERWKDIFTITEEPIVSSDIIGRPHASIADLNFTKVAGGNLIKILAWYDNEMGYTGSLLQHVIKAGKLL